MTAGIGLTGEEDHLIINLMLTKKVEPMETTIDVSSNVVLFVNRGDFSFDFAFFYLTTANRWSNIPWGVWWCCGGFTYPPPSCFSATTNAGSKELGSHGKNRIDKTTPHPTSCSVSHHIRLQLLFPVPRSKTN